MTRVSVVMLFHDATSLLQKHPVITVSTECHTGVSAAVFTLLRFPKRSLYITGGADKSLARPTSRCILFDGENISFEASLVIYI